MDHRSNKARITKEHSAIVQKLCEAHNVAFALSYLRIADGRKCGYLLCMGDITHRGCFDRMKPTRTFSDEESEYLITLIPNGWKLAVIEAGEVWVGETGIDNDGKPQYIFRHVDSYGNEEDEGSNWCENAGQAFDLVYTHFLPQIKEKQEELNRNKKQGKRKNASEGSNKTIKQPSRKNGKVLMGVHYEHPQELLRTTWSNRTLNDAGLQALVIQWLNSNQQDVYEQPPNKKQKMQITVSVMRDKFAEYIYSDPLNQDILFGLLDLVEYDSSSSPADSVSSGEYSYVESTLRSGIEQDQRRSNLRIIRDLINFKLNEMKMDGRILESARNRSPNSLMTKKEIHELLCYFHIRKLVSFKDAVLPVFDIADRHGKGFVSMESFLNTLESINEVAVNVYERCKKNETLEDIGREFLGCETETSLADLLKIAKKNGNPKDSLEAIQKFVFLRAAPLKNYLLFDSMTVTVFCRLVTLLPPPAPIRDAWKVESEENASNMRKLRETFKEKSAFFVPSYKGLPKAIVC